MMHSSPPQPPRGGAPVGVLSELPPIELAAIQYLRLWFSGEQVQVWHQFSTAFARDDAEVAMASFEALMQSVANHARRPLMRHNPACDCFGGDECAFAQFVAAAAHGDEHDAMTFGLHLFGGVGAKYALSSAAMCGHAFLNMAGGEAAPRTSSTRPTHPSPVIKQ